MSTIVESGCPGATEELPGVIERVVKAVALAKCPLTLSGVCEYPDSCLGCYDVIDRIFEARAVGP